MNSIMPFSSSRNFNGISEDENFNDGCESESDIDLRIHDIEHGNEGGSPSILSGFTVYINQSRL